VETLIEDIKHKSEIT